MDASKTTVNWASENAKLSGLEEATIRWIVDDAAKFVAREVKRGKRYQGVILDPPSFGRGNKGQTWKIETDLPPLMENIGQLLADGYCFVILSSHSAGYTPLALENMLRPLGGKRFVSEEMVIPESNSERVLPAGATCLMTL